MRVGKRSLNGKKDCMRFEDRKNSFRLFFDLQNAYSLFFHLKTAYQLSFAPLLFTNLSVLAAMPCTLEKQPVT